MLEVGHGFDIIKKNIKSNMKKVERNVERVNKNSPPLKMQE